MPASEANTRGCRAAAGEWDAAAAAVAGDAAVLVFVGLLLGLTVAHAVAVMRQSVAPWLARQRAAPAALSAATACRWPPLTASRRGLHPLRSEVVGGSCGGRSTGKGDRAA